MKITALAEAEHYNANIGKTQIEFIKQYNKPCLVVMEMSPISLWILQNKIFEGVKQISKLKRYIYSAWSNIKEDLVKLAIQGKIYLMSYDVVQICTGNFVKHVKEYFNIDMYNPWVNPIYDIKKLDKIIAKFKKLKMTQLDDNNKYYEIHGMIFKQIIKHIKISYRICSNNPSKNYYLKYMLHRDQIGAKYVANVLNKFNNLDAIIICHAVHSYYEPTIPHTFDEDTPDGRKIYSNDLKPFVSNLSPLVNCKVTNILIIDKGKKYPAHIGTRECLEYNLINNIKLKNNKNYVLAESYIFLYPNQFDKYIIS